MSEDKLLTVREVSIMLGITEKEVIELAEKGLVPAYKVGGVYLRFKREQVNEFKKKNAAVSAKSKAAEHYTFAEKFRDFLYYNDFYIFVFALVICLFVIIFHG